MSDSTSLLDTISTSQAQKEVTANALFDSASFAMLFARRATTTTALTWGFIGGPIFVGGARSYIANGTVALNASTTNYVEVDTAGVVTVATSQTAGKMLLYKVVTGASTVTSYEDHRSPITMAAFFFQYVAVAMADTDKTLTHAQALCATIECTGALTLGRNLIAPTARRRFVVFNNTTGGFAVTVKTAAGTGIAVAMGDRATVESDWTNIVLVANSGGSFPVSDATFGIKGSADATKVAKFEVDGFTTATTRTFTLPDASITLLGTSGTGAVNAIPYLSAGNVAVADATKLAFDGTTFSLNGDYSQTRTWNNGATTFTAIKMNVTDTASAAGSLLMDLQIGGVSRESTDKAGNKILARGLTIAAGGSAGLQFQDSDLSLIRDAANILAQRNGTAAQVFRLYNTFTDASNYERLGIRWASNVLRIGTESAGTGSQRNIELSSADVVQIFNNGVLRWTLSSTSFTAEVDNTQDIGASGANRPRTLYLGTGLGGKSGAAAPTASDIPASQWMLWKNTTDATVKLYYNDAGTLKSVALT